MSIIHMSGERVWFIELLNNLNVIKSGKTMGSNGFIISIQL